MSNMFGWTSMIWAEMVATSFVYPVRSDTTVRFSMRFPIKSQLRPQSIRLTYNLSFDMLMWWIRPLKTD
jgi:hypothetical protein